MDDGGVSLGGSVFEVDTKLAGYPEITAGYLIRTERPCLVETGTAYSAPVVRDALGSLGVGADDLATIVVTHIHLDHAGGVGDLARMFPRAEIVVHERGARHLADPSRLMDSARLVFGPVLDEMWGPLAPTDPHRIRAVGAQDVVDLGGGRELRSYYSPGHAQHHIGLVDSETGDLYVGDAAGIYIPQTATLRAATPPPDFDLDVSLTSLGLFADLTPTRLLFAHYGPVADVAGTLDRSAEELRVWVELAREARREGLDTDHAVALVRDRTAERYAALRARPELDERFEQLSPTAGNLAGINRWLDRVEGPG